MPRGIGATVTSLEHGDKPASNLNQLRGFIPVEQLGRESTGAPTDRRHLVNSWDSREYFGLFIRNKNVIQRAERDTCRWIINWI